MPGGRAQRTVVFQGKPEKVLTEKYGLLYLVEKHEVQMESQLMRVVAQHTFPERIERADLHERVAVRDQEVDPLLHLVGRLLRKGHGQDLIRPGRLGRDKVGDPMRDDFGFSGASTGDDQEGPFAIHDRPCLLLVQALQQLIHRPHLRT